MSIADVFGVDVKVDPPETPIGFLAIRDDRHKYRLIYCSRVYQTVDIHLAMRRPRNRGHRR